MAVSFNGTLADSDADGFDGHQDLRISARDVVQSEAVIGAVNGFYKGRGNSVYTVSFSARKRHADVAAAVSYCGNHAQDTRGNHAFSGFGLSLTNATCNVTVAHESGVVTKATYEITGTETDA